ncbi:hypothetical protein OWM07_03165 [Deferribacter thermophilus]|uniref:nucleotide-binding protein n=1 Tax=Deferribacter thermophilus TaxID=53573 RepID=UPI003C2341BF
MKSKKNFSLILQGKGGVGKSLLAAMLTQYFTTHQKDVVLPYDVDAEQNTLAKWVKDAVTVDVLNAEIEDIDKEKFYDFFEQIMQEQGKNIVIDVGTSISKSFLTFLKELQVLKYLTDIYNVHVFTIVTSDDDTVMYLNNLWELNQPVYVFKNEYFGKVNYETDFNFYPIHDLNKRIVRKVTELKIPYENINKDKRLMVLEKQYASQFYLHFWRHFRKIFKHKKPDFIVGKED